MSSPATRRGWSRKKRSLFALAVITIGFGAALTLWPVAAPRVELPEKATPFRWHADDVFTRLEAEFAERRRGESRGEEAELAVLEAEAESLLQRVGEQIGAPYEDLDRLASLQFELGVLGAASPGLLPRIQDLLVRSRVAVMKAAEDWPRGRETHEALYRVLFGARMVLDEALIQVGVETLDPLLRVEEIPSAAPSILVEGVRVHSGDILLSRGGAPTSALIARGNDFPNSFSHAALVHVDPESGEGTVIESLIERGSVTSTVAEYLESKKHRIQVLRLRPDHPALEGDPMLAHEAADRMLARLGRQWIPYDFAMRWDDGAAFFCSEVVFHAYREVGIELWTLRSAMSSPGLARWLTGLGVKELVTLVPSDIEYDPQLRTVVEWRNSAELMAFRIDNAILDVLLEAADEGADLGYSWYLLPAARAVKMISMAGDGLGLEPKIPRGMSAPSALVAEALVSEIGPVLRHELAILASAFEEEKGYAAPYWELVKLARQALAEHRERLRPALRSPPTGS